MPEALLLDTDILIDIGRAIPEALAFLEQSDRAAMPSISVVTEMELVVGCRSKVELRRLHRFLNRFQVVQLDEAVSETGSQLMQQYFLSHGLLIPDALIAATALTQHIPLATKNRQDYRFIPGLQLVPYP